MAKNGSTIHVEIDPNAPLPERYIGTSEDGLEYGPMSLFDAIIAAAADRLVNKALKDEALKEAYRSLTEHMRKIRDEMIREAIAPLIEEALNGPLRKTNSYGEPIGKETTLRELIGEQVRAELQSKGDRYSSSGETVLGKTIRETVNRELTNELKAALDAGKSEVLAALRKQGTVVIDEALRKALPL